jgi:hypothetical protein
MNLVLLLNEVRLDSVKHTTKTLNVVIVFMYVAEQPFVTNILTLLVHQQVRIQSNISILYK